MGAAQLLVRSTMPRLFGFVLLQPPCNGISMQSVGACRCVVVPWFTDRSVQHSVGSCHSGLGIAPHDDFMGVRSFITCLLQNQEHDRNV